MQKRDGFGQRFPMSYIVRRHPCDRSGDAAKDFSKESVVEMQMN
jgi:hypothetical protein